ncbi:MAG: FtsH protease activity modulator HflK [Rhodospirillales bacterium]|nr:MAG: FtsH protease activity modulator HflK [Rhodospirillales bacterium]
MAWNQKGGGGPWGGGGNGGGPWGGGGPSSNPPPDVEEMLRRTQERFKSFLPGGFGGGRGIALILAGVVAIWLATGFYRVQPGEQGVELMFGEFVKMTAPGLNYWFPAPIGEVITPNVEQTNTVTIGFRGTGDVTRDVPRESLMLTGDQNIIDVDVVIQWRIKDAADFLFNIRDPENTIKLAGESAMREVVGQTPLEEALTIKRQEVDERTRVLLQEILDGYGAGVHIADVRQLKVDPPSEVIDAFNDVQRARQDKERSVNEALAYRNDIVPRAKGEGERVIQGALAYRDRLLREAEGEAQRFNQVYAAYAEGREVTTRRLYLEKMQEILSETETIIIDNGAAGAQGVVPYLPLHELQRRTAEVRTGQETR